MENATEHVILVDANDREVGTMEKMEAHRKGILHRAFSVLIFNSENQLLLQKRAQAKYHSGGLWTNTCCSHPHPGEAMNEAIQRRLQHEMGIRVDTSYSYKFTYKTSLGDITEHEVDHVYVGRFDDAPSINPEEVEDWCYQDLGLIRRNIALNPNAYTYWFKEIMLRGDLATL